MAKHNEQNTPSGFKNYLNDDSAEHVTFIENRILKSITWYDMKAAKYKKCYVLLTSSSIVINAGIPILSAYTNLTLLVAVLSACAGVCTSILALNKFHELWIKYRYNCEVLKHHLYSYYASVCDYKEKKTQEDAFQHLCANCEALIISDVDSWQSAHISAQSSAKV